MVVPIDRVGRSMLAPRWSTPEELELDEVPGDGQGGTADGPTALLAVVPMTPPKRSINLWLLWLAAPSLGRERLGGGPLGVFTKLLEGFQRNLGGVC